MLAQKFKTNSNIPPAVSVRTTHTELTDRQNTLCRSLPFSQNVGGKKPKATINVTARATN